MEERFYVKSMIAQINLKIKINRAEGTKHI